MSDQNDTPHDPPPHPLPAGVRFERTVAGGRLINDRGHKVVTGIGWIGPDPSAERWAELVRLVTRE